MVCVLVQRRHLRLGNCTWHGYVRTHADQVSDPERNRRSKDISPIRAQRPEPAKNRMACAVGRSQGVCRPAVALTGPPRKPHCNSAKGHPERRKFAHEQRQGGEVAGYGASPRGGCRRGKNSSGLGAIARFGGDPEASGGVVSSRNRSLETADYGRTGFGRSISSTCEFSRKRSNTIRRPSGVISNVRIAAGLLNRVNCRERIVPKSSSQKSWPPV